MSARTCGRSSLARRAMLCSRLDVVEASPHQPGAGRAGAPPEVFAGWLQIAADVLSPEDFVRLHAELTAIA